VHVWSSDDSVVRVFVPGAMAGDTGIVCVVVYYVASAADRD
jgi:hypothetical protein